VHAPVNTLYTLARPSALAVASLFPVLLKVASKTSSLCPLNVSIHAPVPTSHNLHVLSIDPVKQYSPVKSNCPQDNSPE
jgi:hypothetical protein